jgi:hypothetical protein
MAAPVRWPHNHRQSGDVRSQPGYHGTDFIAWDAMTARGNGGHVDVTIAVK